MRAPAVAARKREIFRDGIATSCEQLTGKMCLAVEIRFISDTYRSKESDTTRLSIIRMIPLCNGCCNQYNTAMAKKLLNVSEAAEELGCHKSTVSRQVAALGLGTKIGRQMIVLSEAEVRKLAKVIEPRPRPEDKS